MSCIKIAKLLLDRFFEKKLFNNNICNHTHSDYVVIICKQTFIGVIN